MSVAERLLAAECAFYGSRYAPVLSSARTALSMQNEAMAVKLLDSLPTKEQLLDSLSVHLRNKPVFDTLKKIESGTVKNKFEAAKGLFSLGTHLAIECERGNVEFRPLLVEVYERIGQLIL